MLTYRLRQKKARNLLIAQYASQNPEQTLAEIGQVFQISKQRVWQILQKFKKP